MPDGYSEDSLLHLVSSAVAMVTVITCLYRPEVLYQLLKEITVSRYVNQTFVCLFVCWLVGCLFFPCVGRTYLLSNTG